MNFQDCIAKERDDEFGEKTCWRLEITPPPEQLVLHSWRVENGKEKFPWFYSVFAKDLDPQSVIIEEPYEDNDLPCLRANCVLYRGGITEKRAFEPSFLRQCVVLHFPTAKDISDIEAAKKSLEDFLISCGARSPIVKAVAIEDLLEPLRAALEPSARAEIHSQDKKTTFKQSVTVDSQKMHLICKTERAAGRKVIPLWELPMRFWSIRRYLTPRIEWDTFELLSLDMEKTEVRRTPDETNTWTASLYSVERLNTRLHSNSAHPNTHRMWYVDVFFPSETEANRFVGVCSGAVEQIRERLYQLHQKTA